MTQYYEKNTQIKSYTDWLKKNSKTLSFQPSKIEKIRIRKARKESPRRCIQILKRWRREEFNSWEEMAEFLQVKRMTIYRWIFDKSINQCYMSLIYNIDNDLKLGIRPKFNTLTPEDALTKLEEFKRKKELSWDQVAKALGMVKRNRTIERWQGTGEISKAYLKRLEYFFKEHPLN